MKSHSEIVWETVRSRSGAAVSAIAASWCRSALKHGLDPAESRRLDRVAEAEVRRAREARAGLLRIAGPVLDHLYTLAGRSGCGVVLTDDSGIILERRTTAADTALFNQSGLAIGANWGEQAEGTNGIGTCLAEDRPVTIHRGQHFHSRNAGMSCMDAPVHDEHGHLIAALDVSSCRYDHDESTTLLVGALVADAARKIERAWFLAAFPEARIICGPETAGSGPALLAVDRDDLVIGATRAARRLYGLTKEALADPRPAADILGGADDGFGDSERAVLKRALARSGGNVAAAARALGIGRATFYRRMSRAGPLK